MIKENVYDEMATAFGTSVGVARAIGYKTKKEVIKEEGLIIYNETKGDISINDIISDSIYFEIYHKLQHEVYKIKQTGSKKLKELTIYRRAYNQLMKDEEDITKP